MLDLATHLGMTAGRLMREMTPREFALWKIKFAEDPWGEYRADLRMAKICETLANINRNAEKKPDPFTLKEFMLFEREFVEPEGDEDDDLVTSPGGTTVAPETVSWLYAMAEKTVIEKKKARAAANGG